MLVDLAKDNIKKRVKEIKLSLMPLYVVSLCIG